MPTPDELASILNELDAADRKPPADPRVRGIAEALADADALEAWRAGVGERERAVRGQREQQAALDAAGRDPSTYDLDRPLPGFSPGEASLDQARDQVRRSRGLAGVLPARGIAGAFTDALKARSAEFVASAGQYAPGVDAPALDDYARGIDEQEAQYAPPDFPERAAAGIAGSIPTVLAQIAAARGARAGVASALPNVSPEAGNRIAQALLAGGLNQVVNAHTNRGDRSVLQDLADSAIEAGGTFLGAGSGIEAIHPESIGRAIGGETIEEALTSGAQGINQHAFEGDLDTAQAWKDIADQAAVGGVAGGSMAGATHLATHPRPTTRIVLGPTGGISLALGPAVDEKAETQVDLQPVTGGPTDEDFAAIAARSSRRLPLSPDEMAMPETGEQQPVRLADPNAATGPLQAPAVGAATGEGAIARWMAGEPPAQGEDQDPPTVVMPERQADATTRVVAPVAERKVDPSGQVTPTLPDEPAPGMPDDLAKGISLLAMERQHHEAVAQPGASVRPFGQQRTATVVSSEGTGGEATVHLRFDDTGHEAAFLASDLDLAGTPAVLPDGGRENRKRTDTASPADSETRPTRVADATKPAPRPPMVPDEAAGAPLERARFRAGLAQAMGISPEELQARITAGPTPISTADFGEREFKAWMRSLRENDENARPSHVLRVVEPKETADAPPPVRPRADEPAGGAEAAGADGVVADQPVRVEAAPGAVAEGAPEAGDRAAPGGVADRPAAAPPAGAPRGLKRAKFPEGPHGHDIANAIAEEGGIRSRPKGYRGGEYDGAPRAVGIATRLYGGEVAPDVLAARLKDRGYGDGTVETMWRSLGHALEARSKAPARAELAKRPEGEPNLVTGPTRPVAPVEATPAAAENRRARVEADDHLPFSGDRVPGDTAPTAPRGGFMPAEKDPAVKNQRKLDLETGAPPEDAPPAAEPVKPADYREDVQRGQKKREMGQQGLFDEEAVGTPGQRTLFDQASGEQAHLEYQASGRLPIAPLPDGTEAAKVRPLRQIIGDLADWLGATIYAPNRKMPRGGGGYYSPASGAMVMRRASDLDTTAHEMGHWIADVFSVLAGHQSVQVRGEAGAEEMAAADANEAIAAAFDHELSKFWPYGSEPPRQLNEAGKRNYQRDEGLAEYLRAWMVNPEAARAAAPLFAGHLEAKVPAEVMERLRTFGDDIRRFHHAPAVEAGAANIRELGDTGQMGFARAVLDRMPAKLGGKVRDQVHQPLRFGFRDWLRYRFTNRLNPLVKAIRWAAARGPDGAEKRGARAERLIQLLGGANDRINAVAQHGMVKGDWLKDGRVQRAEGVHGGIDWLMGWMDARSEESIASDQRALDSYMVADRTVEQATLIDKERTDFLTNKMAEIAAAYGDAKEELEKAAEKIRGRAERTAGKLKPASDNLATIKGESKEMAAEGKKAAGRGSDARARIAKRADAISRAVLRATSAVESSTESIGKDAEKQIERLFDAVDAEYARKVEQLARVGKRMEMRDRIRKSRLSGQGGGTRPDDEQARRILAEVAKDPLLQGRLAEGAKRYRAWANGVLRYLVDKGRLSEEQYEAITVRNQHYVAMNRIREDGIEGAFRPTGGGKVGVAKEVVKSFRGSQREIENPLVNLVEATERSIAEADRNEAMRAVVDLLREARRMHEGEAPDLAAVGERVQAGEPGAVKVFRNGAEEAWKFAPQVMDAVKGLGEQYRLPPILTVLPRLLHAGVINNPAFAVTNRLRDIQHRLIAGQSAPRGALEAMTRLKDQLPVVGTRFDEQQKLITQLAGGAFTGHYMRGKENWHRELVKRSNQLRKDRSTIVATGAKLLGSYRHLLESSEFSGRLDEFWPVFDRLRAQGIPEMEAAQMAAQAARNIVDFAQAGTWMAVVNQLVPFTNAAAQGLRATGNAFLRNPAGFTARWAMFAAVPSILTYMLAALRGDDDLEEYRNLPAWRRDLFYNIKVGANLWISIPKPFEIGVMASGAERGVEAGHRVAKGEDAGEATTKAFSGFGGSMARGLLPVDEKSMALAFSPLIETFLANRNFYTGREIVPSYEKDLPVDQRKGNAHASRLGLLGQWLSGDHLDARQVDNLISGTFGGVGGLAMTTSDLGRADKATGPLDIAKRTVGIVRAGAGPDQQDVQQFVTDEREAGRAHGKPIQAIQQMTSAYWKATTGEERDAMAAAMRDYVEGRDPLMAFDRAATVANQLQSAMKALPPADRGAFARAHRVELGRAQALDKGGQQISAARRAGIAPEKVREMARRIMQGVQSIGGGAAAGGDEEP